MSRLPKPTVAVWAINQAARRDRHAITSFLGAVERWRRAYARGGEGVPAATAAERRALEAVLAAARDSIEHAHERVTTDVVRRITNTLRAAAATRASTEALRRGRLSEEGQLSGFELVPGVRRPAPAAARRERRRATRGTPRQDPQSEGAQTLGDTTRAAVTAHVEAGRVGRRRRAIAGRAAQYRRAADAAEREAARLRERLRAADARAARARAAAERARDQARGGA